MVVECLVAGQCSEGRRPADKERDSKEGENLARKRKEGTAPDIQGVFDGGVKNRTVRGIMVQCQEAQSRDSRKLERRCRWCHNCGLLAADRRLTRYLKHGQDPRFAGRAIPKDLMSLLNETRSLLQRLDTENQRT